MSVTKLLFAIQLAVGLLMLTIGVVVDPLRPYTQLDAVLTPEQLRDDQTREQALVILKRLREVSNDRLVWSISGLTIAATAGAGLWLRDEPSHSK
jgi:hypothetical protein